VRIYLGNKLSVKSAPLEPCSGGGFGFGAGTSSQPISIPIVGMTGSVPIRVDVVWSGMTGSQSAQAAFQITAVSGTEATPGDGTGSTGSSRLVSTPPAKIALIEIREPGAAGTTDPTTIDADIFVRLDLPGPVVADSVYRIPLRGEGANRMLELLEKAFEENWTVVLIVRPQAGNTIAAVRVIR
jgi:hypothetical protein